MRGWARLVLICYQQKRTFGGWRTCSRDFASHFCVSYDIFRSSWKRSSPCFQHVPSDDGGGCPYAADPKHPHSKKAIDVSSAIPHSIRLSVKLLSLLATQQKWYRHLQLTAFLPGCTCVHLPTMTREGKPSTYIRWCSMCFTGSGTVELQLCLLLQISPTCEKHYVAISSLWQFEFGV